MFKRLFGKKKTQEQLEAEYEAWHEAKSAFMETVLGKEHDMVMHAIIPFAVGGGLDLYYYPNLPDALGGAGTAIATKELVESPGQGPRNRVYKAYEIVMATRHAINLDEAKDETTPFGKAHRTINSVLNPLARYAPEATLNPNETMSFPEGFGDLSGRHLILDALSPIEESATQKVGLMLVMEVFESESRYAQENQAGEVVIQKLKDAGHYPYCDMDREPVV